VTTKAQTCMQIMRTQALDKRWFPVRTAHSREFVYVFVFTHATRHKICNFLHEENSKFHVNRHYGCETLCFVLSDYITRWNNFLNVKVKKNCWKKNLKCFKDEVCATSRIKSIHLPPSDIHKHCGSEAAQHGLEIIFQCLNVLLGLLLCYIISEHQAYRRLSECKETVNYTLPLRSSSSLRFFWADYEPAVFVLSTYTQLPCQEEQEHSHAEDGTLRSVDAVKILTTNMNAVQGYICYLPAIIYRGLENAALGLRPRAAFSSPRSQFFTIRTDPKLVNNLFIFFLL